MFINTLPIIFTYTHLLEPSEFFIGLVFVFFIIYFNAPAVSMKREFGDYSQGAVHGLTGRLYVHLLTLWLGQGNLKLAFWPFFIFINGLLYYIDYRIFNLTFTIASWKTAHFMVAIPCLWWLVAVWRCSIYTAHKFWASVARFFTVCLIIEFGLRIFIVMQYPNTFFDCALLVVHYGDCF